MEGNDRLCLYTSRKHLLYLLVKEKMDCASVANVSTDGLWPVSVLHITPYQQFPADYADQIV